MENLVVSAVFKSVKKQSLFYGYHIEQPTQGLDVTGSKLVVSGWVVGKTPVSAIEVNSELEKALQFPVNLPRPRLYEAFGVEGHSGPVNFAFKGEVKVPTQKVGGFTISLHAVFADSSKAELGSISLNSKQFYNRLSKEAKPDFIIIGAMKSATSAIYKYLMQHPDIINRYPKELNFFSRKSEFQKGILHYSSYFSEKLERENSRSVLIGEASPEYLFSKDVPLRVYEHFPKVKLIVSLRNPVDRAISHFYHQLNRVRDEARTIEEAFSKNQFDKAQDLVKSVESGGDIAHNSSEWMTARYLATGHYYLAINRWLQYFPRNQILVINYHQLEATPYKLLGTVFNFLNLSDYSIPNVDVVFANSYPDPPQTVIDNLSNYYEESNQKLYNGLNIDFRF